MPLTDAGKEAALAGFADEADLAGLHRATVLTDDAAHGGDQIEVEHQVAVGAVVTIDPDGPDEETFLASAVTGSGPWTVTLITGAGEPALIETAHVTGTFVAYTPTAGTLREPGGSYARQAVTWSAPDGDHVDTSNAPTFSVPDGTAITHGTFFDSGGALLGDGRVPLAVFTAAGAYELESGSPELE